MVTPKNNQQVKRSGKIIVSGFTSDDKLLLKCEKIARFYQQFGIQYDAHQLTIDNDCTHLVVAARHVAPRTKKYFQALVKGVWIIGEDWVLDSYRAGKLLLESQYQVRGCQQWQSHVPERSRLAHKFHKWRLLDMFTVVMAG